MLPVVLFLKPLVIRFCPFKIISDYFRLFYSVNTQNLKESERICKGQKRFTKGFLEIDIVRLARKNETFQVGFKHCEILYFNHEFIFNSSHPDSLLRSFSVLNTCLTTLVPAAYTGEINAHISKKN